jgi:hypothetical protein
MFVGTRLNRNSNVGADAFVRPTILSDAKGRVQTVWLPTRCRTSGTDIVRLARNPGRGVRGYTNLPLTLLYVHDPAVEERHF